ncbi:MAG: LAGLIDADG family homing endonuclease [archaeon]|nr:helix-turn-helix domain-containing protein [archaeon]
MDESIKLILLKRKIKELSAYKGQGTQLISLYLPPDVDRSTVNKQLTDEISQSSNIKSAQTRKNVQSALRRLVNYLKQIDFKLPENGLILFSGDVSTNPSKSDVTLIDIEPPKRLTTKLYWCDSSFHIVPLEEMVETDQIYGVIAVDKRETTIAVIRGKLREIVGHETSGVPGKTRAGGQCLKDAIVQLSDGNILNIEDLNKESLISANLNNYKLIDSKIKNKWNITKTKTYIISTKFPRLEIKCSEDHLLYVNSELGIVEKTAKELKVGDFLIMPEKIDILGKVQSIDSSKYYNSFEINKDGQNYIKKIRLSKNLYQRDLANKVNISQAQISDLETGKKDLSLNILKNVCIELNINFSQFLKKYTKKILYKNVVLPTKVDYNFSQFLGYLIVDGSIEEDIITFFEQDKNVALSYKLKFDNLFKLNSSLKFRPSKNYHQLRFISSPLVRLIKNEFVEIRKTLDSKVPKKVLLSSNKVVSGFLKGIYDAKGAINLSRKSISLNVNNKKLAQEIQLLLLRFSIISSLIEFDNHKNKYTENKKFTIDISEKESVDLFTKYISFTSTKKISKLKLITNKSLKNNSRQILISGKRIKEIIEKHELNLEQFPKVSSFFNNKGMISKQTFKNSILNNIKNKLLKKELQNILDYSILPVKINKINVIKEKSNMVDISVINKNFIANSLVVHNSAHRFERLREKAAEDFYKRVGAKVNAAFVPIEGLKGMIIGGPGTTKHEFIEHAGLDHRIKDKILGTVDVSYTDESGIKEILDKSSEILKEVGIVKEKKLIEKFISEIAKNNLGIYGFKEVQQALDYGQVSTILISEGLEWFVLKFKCLKTGQFFFKIAKTKDEVNNIINSVEQSSKDCQDLPSELIEESDLFDYFLDQSQKTSSEVILVSVETPEGKSFLDTFGGIGAFLRYK